MKIPVFINRDNAETLKLSFMAEDGREVSVTNFLAAVTRTQLVTRAGTVDTNTSPQSLSIDAAAQTITLKLGSHFTVAGAYPAQLIMISSTYPNGYVWIDRYDAEPNRRLVLNVVSGS